MGPFKPDGKKPPAPVLLPSVAMAMICGDRHRADRCMFAAVYNLGRRR